MSEVARESPATIQILTDFLNPAMQGATGHGQSCRRSFPASGDQIFPSRPLHGVDSGLPRI